MDEILKLIVLLMVNIAVCGKVVNKSTIEKPRIYFLHVNSEIKYRFSKTVITSKVVNSGEGASEAFYDVTLPNEAFITSFKVIINGTEYNGQVKEKTQAKQEYDKAKSRGQSAGHIVTKPRDSNKFQVQIHVAAAEKVTFELIYRELLLRRLGRYEQLIYIDPGQTVDDFQVEVTIEEYRNITLVNVPPIRNDKLTDKKKGQNKDADIVRLSPTQVKISYSLTKSQQEILSEQGISGQFVVQYDVEREKNAGEVLVMDGYFVHFLAPDGLDPMPMDIVFVLDRSGSMKGKKMKQLKKSMFKILDEISSNDRFTLIAFDNRLKFWRRELSQATITNLADAKQFIQNTDADGMTDINLAVTEGLKLLSKNTQESRAPILVFLTDGEPTSGVTKTKRILENIKKFNDADIPIFSLAFGRDADYDFTKKIAAQNDGLGKRIYEDSDADLQIAGFYREISTVLMRNISFKYVDGFLNETSLTQTNFNIFFEGSELVVAGEVEDVSKLQSGIEVFATGLNSFQLTLERSAICFLPPPRQVLPIPPYPTLQPQPKHPNVMENLWAYLTIKQLIRKKDGIDDKEEISDIGKKILDMSLKYRFVTPLTSMVVTLPDDSKSKSFYTDDTQVKSSSGSQFKRYNNRRRKTDVQVMDGALIPRSPVDLGGTFFPQIASKFNTQLRRLTNFKDVGTGTRSQLASIFDPIFNRGKFNNPFSRTTSTKTILPGTTTNPTVKTQTAPSFLVKVSKVNMCFDLPLKNLMTYDIIKRTNQTNGCAMFAKSASKQNGTTETFGSIKIEKYRVGRLLKTFNVEASKNLPSFECNVDGIKLGIEEDPHGLSVKVEIRRRQRKHYDGILSHFVNMKCKTRRRFSRKGKLMANVLCRRRGRPTLKIKVIEKTLQSGNTCWFLNRKMVNLLNINPTNYETKL